MPGVHEHACLEPVTIREVAMRRIAVVGAGQAGLQLALGLRQAGFETTLVTDRTVSNVRDGRVLSTQCMFGDALQTERDLGLAFWEDECPKIDRIRYSVGLPEGQLVLQLTGRLGAYAQSVDQRVKMPAWMDAFEEQGGVIDLRTVDLAYAERLAEQHDLVVIASGKGVFARELAGVFHRIDADSPYDRPERELAVAYVRDLEPLDPPSAFSISIVPGVGEYFVGPALTLDGPCWTMCFEAIPGGPMDLFGDVSADDPDRWLQRCRDVLSRFMPWEAERCERIRLTDPLGTLKGAVTPVVRERVGLLPSGRLVLGIGDAVVLNDPLVGQGANCAAKGATGVLRELVARRGDDVEEGWLRGTGDAYWESARWSTAFTNMMLRAPAHIPEVLAAAAESPALADVLANGTNDPSTLFPWIATADRAQDAVARLTAGTTPT
jgi:2-polyprenyl-6-methoxyphenol hydroxylase-like FAD-dependent oxidoreductase